MGQLIPVMCDEVVPGDIFNIQSQAVIRFQPLVAPILHEVNIFAHYFFVPYRILWNREVNEELNDELEPEADEYEGSWEDFITGGEDGADTSTIPTWDPGTGETDPLSLWDYLGFPVSIADPAGVEPIDFPRRAYNLIWNEYYRDENLQAKESLTAVAVQQRNWEKDYFTSALLSQQKGTAPSLALSGIAYLNHPASSTNPGAGSNALTVANTATIPTIYAASANGETNLDAFLDSLYINMSDANTFDVADLRLIFQVQKWLERNARAGSRYCEFLRAHFDVSPRDERLQRPEYIGGSKSPVIISEVLQTSSTDGTSPQGNLAGHGIAVNNSFCGKYRATEFGLIMGIFSVMPKPSYQQGINRQWLRQTKYDFYFPEFANLSEQAILKGEIFVTNANAGVNIGVFGYQGRYDEMRTKQNLVCGNMRSTFDYWHISRQFASVPTLNGTFVNSLDIRKDCFAAPSEPGLIVQFANIIKAFRPMPYMAEPGLIDHN